VVIAALFDKNQTSPAKLLEGRNRHLRLHFDGQRQKGNRAILPDLIVQPILLSFSYLRSNVFSQLPWQTLCHGELCLWHGAFRQCCLGTVADLIGAACVSSSQLLQGVVLLPGKVRRDVQLAPVLHPGQTGELRRTSSQKFANRGAPQSCRRKDSGLFSVSSSSQWCLS
jgi:hypothetical protein